MKLSNLAEVLNCFVSLSESFQKFFAIMGISFEKAGFIAYSFAQTGMDSMLPAGKV
jgi:hypothetical protein